MNYEEKAREVYLEYFAVCDHPKGLTPIITALRETAEPLEFLRNSYSRVGARGCPACEYQNGKFIKMCKLHEEIDSLTAEFEEKVKELDVYFEIATGKRKLPDASK